ncbi:alpha/beta hydrolase family protein [Dyella sp. 20L07]|uniref:alpha/beta hydrolase family protein n=1 Tax=Dyella sp. 20L07 TaxID=3384240 RepID=UPI003D2715F6
MLFATLVAVFVYCTDALAQNAATGTPPAATTSISDFIRHADFSQVSISPDGKYIAALVPMVGKPYENYLAILDGQTAQLKQALRSGRDALIANYFWNDNGRLVAALAIKRNGLDTPQLTGELFAIDPDGRNQIDLFGYRAGGSSLGSLIKETTRRYAFARPISTQSAGENQILIAINDATGSRAGSVTYIERLNVRTGKTAPLGESPARNARLIADHAGQVRVAFADNDYTGDLLWARPNNDTPWALINEPAKSHVSISPIGFNRDNSKLYVRVSQGDHPDAIELMDLQSLQRTPLYRGAFANPGEMLPTADHQDYYAVITQDGRKALHYFNEDSPEALLNQALALNFPGQLAYFSSFTPDGKHAIVHVVSDRNPGDFYLFDLESRKAQFLVHAAPWIDAQNMRPMEPVEMRSRDGVAMHGFLTTPAGTKPFPLVILPHGGPHGIFDSWSFNPEVQLLASRGYAVLQVNYRGSGGYGSHFQQLGYRQWGLSMQDDITDATQWAIQQGYANPRRVCIYGASYGGYAALEGAVREPDLYKCAAGYAGVYDLRVQMDESDTQQSDMGEAYLHTVLGTDRDDLLKRSPLSGVQQIKADLLLMHGEDDPRVPFKNFQEFTSALEKSGKHYDALVEPREGHGFFLPAHQEQAYQKLLDFLARNIGSPGIASASDTTITSSDTGKASTH